MATTITTNNNSNDCEWHNVNILVLQIDVLILQPFDYHG